MIHAHSPQLRDVLVVEDDALIAMSIEECVRGFGVQRVELVRSTVDALRAVAGQTFDCAVLDVLISGNETYAVADMLAAQSIPFAFCTGFSREHLPERHRDRPVLTKPYRETDLTDWLAAVSRARREQTIGFDQPAPSDAMMQGC